jgi:hypothetical protein
VKEEPSCSEWPRGTVGLLLKGMSNMTMGQDYVDWAVSALTDGFDSPGLAILGGLDTEGIVYRSDAEKYFQQVVQELGIPVPDSNVVPRELVDWIAERIVEGTVDPVTGVDSIHGLVVSPLGHPSDLMPWCFLWEGNTPDGRQGQFSQEEYAAAIVEFATAWVEDLVAPDTHMSERPVKGQSG